MGETNLVFSGIRTLVANTCNKKSIREGQKIMLLLLYPFVCLLILKIILWKILTFSLILNLRDQRIHQQHDFLYRTVGYEKGLEVHVNI